MCVFFALPLCLVKILYLVMDSPSVAGAAPTKGNSQAYVFLIVFLVIIGNYLLMNLLVCGVVVVYDKLKPDR